MCQHIQLQASNFLCTPDWPGTYNPPASAFLSAGITNMHYHTQLFFFFIDLYELFMTPILYQSYVL
jgi:hypothetical protein